MYNFSWFTALPLGLCRGHGETKTEAVHQESWPGISELFPEKPRGFKEMRFFPKECVKYGLKEEVKP